MNQHILLWFPKCFVFFTTHGRLCFLVKHDLLQGSSWNLHTSLFFRRLFVLQVIVVYAFGFYMIYCEFQGLSWNQYISLFWGNGLFCFMSRWHTRLWIEHDLLWFPGPNLKSTHSTINQIQLTVINLARYETTKHEMKISCNFRGKMLSFL